MRSKATEGVICVRDSETLVEYHIAFITYTVWEDGEFCYEIEPIYEVIELLGPPLFRGIPGINLDLRERVYIRRNRTPVFVSERAPSENREDVRQLLDAEDMEYLNKLEWLIRTNTRYPGDSLYVRRRDRHEERHELDLRRGCIPGVRGADSVRMLLEALGRGEVIRGAQFAIDENNRRDIHALLRELYLKEKTYIDLRRSEGVARAARQGKYRGRKRKSVDDIKLRDVCERHHRGELTARQAATTLGLSVQTFYRRYRAFREGEASSS